VPDELPDELMVAPEFEPALVSKLEFVVVSTLFTFVPEFEDVLLEPELLFV
jgi:hypothetical protein